MRASSLVAVALVAAFGPPAFGQSVYDGPLAAPDAPAQATPHRPKSKPKKVRHAAAKPIGVDTSGAPAPGAAASEAAPPVRASVPDDPLSLGMKWNGNNDSVAQTRSQNLDGNAFGTGAEVGMKLHF